MEGQQDRRVLQGPPALSVRLGLKDRRATQGRPGLRVRRVLLARLARLVHKGLLARQARWGLLAPWDRQGPKVQKARQGRQDPLERPGNLPRLQWRRAPPVRKVIPALRVPQEKISFSGWSMARQTRRARQAKSW
jgi:hypothetical protein